MGLIYGVIAGDVGHEMPRLLARAMWTLPAVWVMGGLAAALYGWLPRFTPLVWAALALFLALEFGWEVQRVSQAVFDISPFAHVHRAREPVVTPLVWLTVIAVGLAAAGLAGFQGRDVGRA